MQAFELKPFLIEHQRDKEVAKRDLDYSVCFHLSANHSFTIAVYHQESAISFSLEMQYSVLSFSYQALTKATAGSEFDIAVR